MGKFKISTIKNGFKFNLVAGNGEIIGTSQAYKSMDAAKKGAESVKNVAPDANIEDQTQENYKKEVVSILKCPRKFLSNFRGHFICGFPYFLSDSVCRSHQFLISQNSFACHKKKDGLNRWERRSNL